MKTTIENIKRFLRHNQAMVASVVVCALLVGWSGCKVTTENPFNPEEKVTKTELTAEVDVYVAKVSAAYEDIERQEMFRQAILEAGWAVAKGGSVDPLGLATTLMGVCGLGAMIDNVKKNSVIVSKTKALNQITDALKGKEAEENGKDSVDV